MLDQAGGTVVDRSIASFGSLADLQMDSLIPDRLTLDMKAGAAVMDTIRDLGGSEAPRRRQDVDRFQQAGLAGTIGSKDPADCERIDS